MHVGVTLLATVTGTGVSRADGPFAADAARSLGVAQPAGAQA